jgi:hypothetical protein
LTAAATKVEKFVNTQQQELVQEQLTSAPQEPSNLQEFFQSLPPIFGLFTGEPEQPVEDPMMVPVMCKPCRPASMTRSSLLRTAFDSAFRELEDSGSSIAIAVPTPSSDDFDHLVPTTPGDSLDSCPGTPLDDSDDGWISCHELLRRVAPIQNDVLFQLCSSDEEAAASSKRLDHPAQVSLVLGDWPHGYIAM